MKKEYDYNGARMTADAIREDCRGQVRRPGLFQCEPIYAPWIYWLLMEGCADESGDDPGWAAFEVDEQDREIFPELADVTEVLIRVSDDGFIYTAAK